MSLRLCLQSKQYTYYFSKSLTWNLFPIIQSRNDYIFSVFVLKSTRQVFFCKPVSFCLIQEAENEMTNTNLMRNVFPPKSLFCYEAQGLFIWRRASPLIPGWSFLPRSHFLPNSNTKFDFSSYEQAGWPAKRDLTGVLARSR